MGFVSVLSMEKPLPKILVVDDNPINVIVLKKFAESFAEVDSANNGAKAMELLKQDNYALILMDINLGKDEVNGVEVLRQIKADAQLEHIPVLAVTAYLSDEKAKELRAAGFADLMEKPINREGIGLLVKKYLPES